MCLVSKKTKARFFSFSIGGECFCLTFGFCSGAHEWYSFSPFFCLCNAPPLFLQIGNTVFFKDVLLLFATIGKFGTRA